MSNSMEDCFKCFGLLTIYELKPSLLDEMTYGIFLPKHCNLKPHTDSPVLSCVYDIHRSTGKQIHLVLSAAASSSSCLVTLD